MAKKRSKASGAGIWWMLAIVVAAFFAWLFSHTAQMGTLPPGSKSTNSFDLSRATNLLHWFGTNLANRPSPPTSAPPPVNLVRSNVVAIRIAPLTNHAATNMPVPSRSSDGERPVRDILEAQIALARLAISSGPIDGVAGYQTRSALRAFQRQNHLPTTGDLDAATRGSLLIAEPVFTTYSVTASDLARLRPVPETWLDKSQEDALDYETILELVAEQFQASHGLIRTLNPALNWSSVAPGTSVKAPLAAFAPAKSRAAFIRIQLSAKTLEAFDGDTNLLAHFPCSIAQRVEKRPLGALYVVKAAEKPNYTFDPDVFPESEEARRLGRKLVIPPGPNNPVGAAWISLDKPGYGIHGTPRPDQVGRTESHGCFRLANWNAEYLLKLAWAGMPVYVEP